MITLNSDKGLIRVEGWDQIEGRPGFVKNLDPKEHKLDRIIGRYIFKEKIHCGLSNCHTPHAKGYIVVTQDGHETNIGKDCGKTYFGVDFETLSRKFDRDILQAENRERLWSFTFRLDTLEEQVASLRKEANGADWVYRQSRPLVTLNSGCPDEVVRRVTSMIKSKANVLTIERLATDEEVEQKEARENRTVTRPYFVDEPVASIAGLEALYPENDLRALLVLELEEKIRDFKILDIDALRHEDLGYWVKWADSVNSTLERATQSIAFGRKLLQPSNLRPFNRLLKTPLAKAQFRTYLRSLEQ